MKKFLAFLGIILLLVLGFLVLKREKPKEVKKKEVKGGEMKAELEGKKVLLVIAPKDFRDEEYQKPRQILEDAGFVVEVASKGVSEAVGTFGAKAQVDKDLSEVNIADYEAIVFVGGVGAATYFNDESALNLAKSAFEKGKVVGAICIAPSILANAGILSGKKATAFSSEQDNLQSKGAQFTGEAVAVDGKIVTANGPQSATEFGRKIVDVVL